MTKEPALAPNLPASAILTLSLHVRKPLTSTPPNTWFNVLAQQRSRRIPELPRGPAAFPLICEIPVLPVLPVTGNTWGGWDVSQQGRWHCATYCLWLHRARSNCQRVPSWLPHPQVPPKVLREGGKCTLQLRSRTFHFFEMSEMKQIGARRVMVTALRKVLTATKWVIMICFSSQIIAFPDIYVYNA